MAAAFGREKGIAMSRHAPASKSLCRSCLFLLGYSCLFFGLREEFFFREGVEVYAQFLESPSSQWVGSTRPVHQGDEALAHFIEGSHRRIHKGGWRQVLALAL